MNNIKSMKDINAVALGKKGGLARWSKVSKKDRAKIMSKVALARYRKLSTFEV